MALVNCSPFLILGARSLLILKIHSRRFQFTPRKNFFCFLCLIPIHPNKACLKLATAIHLYPFKCVVDSSSPPVLFWRTWGLPGCTPGRSVPWRTHIFGEFFPRLTYLLHKSISSSCITIWKHLILQKLLILVNLL